MISKINLSSLYLSMGKVQGCYDDYLSTCCGLYVCLAMPRQDQCPCVFMGCMDRISHPELALVVVSMTSA